MSSPLDFKIFVENSILSDPDVKAMIRKNHARMKKIVSEGQTNCDSLPLPEKVCCNSK